MILLNIDSTTCEHDYKIAYNIQSTNLHHNRFIGNSSGKHLLSYFQYSSIDLTSNRQGSQGNESVVVKETSQLLSLAVPISVLHLRMFMLLFTLLSEERAERG